MVKEQRWQNILSEIKKNDSVTIETIMLINRVSRSTARRDLEDMETENLLRRVRGGAIPLRTYARSDNVWHLAETPLPLGSSNEAEPTFRARETLFQEEKKRIARAAHNLINPGETLMLGGGTTILAFAHTLSDINPLYLATNDLQSALVLSDYDNVDLTILGGSLRRKHYAMRGYFTEQMIAQMHADKAFIGIDAVDLNVGYMNYSTSEIQTNKLMLANSHQKIILADHSKFEKIAFVNICKIHEIDLLITGREIDERYLEKLHILGVNVMTV